MNVVDTPSGMPKELPLPVAGSREQMKDALKTDKSLEEIAEMIKTQDGKKRLIALIQKSNPGIKEDLDAIANQVKLNTEELQKKESFIKKMAKLPVRAVKSVWRAIKKHPILTVVLLISIATAGAYYLGYLPRLGEWGLKLKNLLSGKSGGAAIETVPEVTKGAAKAAEIMKVAAENVKTVEIVEHSVKVGDKLYGIKEFAGALKAMREADPDIVLQVVQTGSSRVTTEHELYNLLTSENIRSVFHGLSGAVREWSGAPMP